MRLAGIDDRFKLQQRVAIVSGLATAMILVVNFAIGVLQSGSFLATVRSSTFWAFVGLGILFAASGVRDSRVFRIVQIAVFYVAGFFVFAGSQAGNATGFLFTIFGVVLHLEYSQGTDSRLWVAIGLTILSVVAYMLLVASTIPALVTTVGIVVFLSAVVFQYGLVYYRSTLIRQKQVESLELLVTRRTEELARKSEEAVGLAEERGVLLHELQHRANNSLQLTISLMDTMEEGEREETLLKMRAIGAAYAIVDTAQSFAELPLREYMERVAGHMEQAHPARPTMVHYEPVGEWELLCGIESTVNLGILVVEITERIIGVRPDVEVIQMTQAVASGMLETRISYTGPAVMEASIRENGGVLLASLFERLDAVGSGGIGGQAAFQFHVPVATLLAERYRADARQDQEHGRV